MKRFVTLDNGHITMTRQYYRQLMLFHMGLNPVRIPSSFIIQQLAKTGRST